VVGYVRIEGKIMSYRQLTRAALERANQQLATGDADHLKYAALELRFALEALTYERALLFKDELPRERGETWQPHKVMAYLLEIDPNADAGATYSFGVEGPAGEAPKEMTFLGHERVLSLRELRTYYARLGSYLHTPTPKQLRAGEGASADRMRERCLEVAAILAKVLQSDVWQADFKRTAKIDCDRCQAPIIRRVTRSDKPMRTECPECGAPYSVELEPGNKALWTPCRVEIKCASPSCDGHATLWQDEITSGSHWACPKCTLTNVLRLGVTLMPKEDAY
jgi:hypothetical protein